MKFPRTVEHAPHATLEIVGADPPGWLVAHAHNDPRIALAGWVDDLAAWLTGTAIVLCPLRIGGGIKIKSLEAIAAGKCVVTTSVGVQGFDAHARRAFLIRDDPSAFAAAIVELLRHPDLRSRQEARAQAVAAELPTWEQASRSLAECWSAAASLRRQQGRPGYGPAVSC
ncbi:glycosyltransferase family 4 protein [Streptomyces sp. NPDC008222]|uniref:glycosyltransferase family 4 protein n=1 Tax=Streptomyces sp. NPDC008222 TaxID=3364820 RepID=UPI0036EEEC9D